MIVFCSFEQMPTLIDAGKKHGLVNYIPLVFIKNYSPQVLKANMRVVGATEYALVMYRGKLPKFRNGVQTDPETGKNIRGTGRMIFNWFRWEKDGNASAHTWEDKNRKIHAKNSRLYIRKGG